MFTKGQGSSFSIRNADNTWVIDGPWWSAMWPPLAVSTESSMNAFSEIGVDYEKLIHPDWLPSMKKTLFI